MNITLPKDEHHEYHYHAMQSGLLGGGTVVLQRRNPSQFSRRYQKTSINSYTFSPKNVLLGLYAYKFKIYNQINPDVHEDISARMFITI